MQQSLTRALVPRSIAIVLIVYLPAFALSTKDKATERQMIEHVRKIRAVELDSKLTNELFGHWLSRIAGPQAEIGWEVNDCGEQTGGPADRGRDLPVCVQAQVTLPDKATLIVMISIGTLRKGVHGRATVKDAFIEKNGETTTLKELSQLPNMLR